MSSIIFRWCFDVYSSLVADFFYCLVAEAHPEVIGEDGVATPEAYEKDLAYLKEKVGTYCTLVRLCS